MGYYQGGEKETGFKASLIIIRHLPLLEQSGDIQNLVHLLEERCSLSIENNAEWVAEPFQTFRVTSLMATTSHLNSQFTNVGGGGGCRRIKNDRESQNLETEIS